MLSALAYQTSRALCSGRFFIQLIYDNIGYGVLKVKEYEINKAFPPIYLHMIFDIL